MNADRNPQAEQMGDAAMARTLQHQADAIWPQERLLFERYRLQGAIRILDLGCGTGEITRRLAERYPQAIIVGIDILPQNLALARELSVVYGERVGYEQGDAFALAHEAGAFDLVVCRHMSQSVPEFQLVLAEITRVLKPGGWLHLLSEDYGMLQMPAIVQAIDGSVSEQRNPEQFWLDHPIAFMRSIGCDARIGRHSPPLLELAGYRDIAMDYAIVDTLRVPRATFAGILEAWRDGFAQVLAQASGREVVDIVGDFDAMIHAVRTPPNYAVWHVPVVSGRKPA